MRVTRDSSHTVHTVVIELTEKEINALAIDQNALPTGFPTLRMLATSVRDATQPKPTSRNLSPVAKVLSQESGF